MSRAQFRTGKDLHSFTVQIDGETSPFRRRRLYLNQITFASESLERLMKWRKAITESVLAMRESSAAEDEDEMYAKCHERCIQATFSAMHLMPTTVLFHAIFAKNSKHLQVTLPPAYSPIHYFVHAVFCSIVYTPCCADEIAEGNETYFARHNVRDWAVIDRGLPAWICDDFLAGWSYDDEFDAPRLGVYYKVIRDSEENQAKHFARTYHADSGAGGVVVAGAASPAAGGADANDMESYLHVVFAVRGTDPTDPEDIRDDLLILRGAFNSSNKRVKWFKRRLREVKRKYKRIIDARDGGGMPGLESVPSSMKVTVTGHSLGGLVAYIVGNDDDTCVPVAGNSRRPRRIFARKSPLTGDPAPPRQVHLQHGQQHVPGHPAQVHRALRQAARARGVRGEARGVHGAGAAARALPADQDLQRLAPAEEVRHEGGGGLPRERRAGRARVGRDGGRVAAAAVRVAPAAVVRVAAAGRGDAEAGLLRAHQDLHRLAPPAEDRRGRFQGGRGGTGHAGGARVPGRAGGRSVAGAVRVAAELAEGRQGEGLPFRALLGRHRRERAHRDDVHSAVHAGPSAPAAEPLPARRPHRHGDAPAVDG